MHEEKIDHGRQDFRIDDVIPISAKKLTSDEFNICKNKVGIRSRQNSMLQQMVGRDIFAGDMQQNTNPEMAEALESLDAKLNYLIGVNMLNDASHSDMQERPVNLSLTGISMVTDCAYKTDDYALVNLMLPSFPPSILELTATVVRIEQISDKRWRIAARFYFRSDDEEDTIAKYVYRRHRETIRASRKRDAIQA